MKFFSAFAVPCTLLAFSICSLILSFSSITVALTKPIIALVPTAWHSPVHYHKYIDQLYIAGYDTVTHQLPSCGSSNPGAQSVAVDATFILQNILMPSINAGKEVLLIMHSYGGGPGAMAAKGLSVAERRAAGQAGGIIGLIFISGFIAMDGQSLLSSSGGKFAPWVIESVSHSLRNSFLR